MLKLITAEIKRYISSLHYLVVLIALFLFHVFKIEGRIYFIYIHWGNGFLDNINFICIALSILMSIYIGEEFSNRTIQNKMSCPTNEHYKHLENLIHYLVNM